MLARGLVVVRLLTCWSPFSCLVSEVAGDLHLRAETTWFDRNGAMWERWICKSIGISSDSGLNLLAGEYFAIEEEEYVDGCPSGAYVWRHRAYG